MLDRQLIQIAATADHTYDQSLGLLKRLFEDRDPAYLLREPAAVCVLFRGKFFDEAEVLLTQRSSTVATHAGQVAFPGGLLDPDDERDPRRAAIRECFEEVGIPVESIQSHAVLEPYPTLGGNFLVTPVLASLLASAERLPLTNNPHEVVFAEWFPVKKLVQSRDMEERVVFGHAIQAPFFMWDERKMWGLSAWIFDSILNRYAKLKA